MAGHSGGPLCTRSAPGSPARTPWPLGLSGKGLTITGWSRHCARQPGAGVEGSRCTKGPEWEQGCNAPRDLSGALGLLTCGAWSTCLGRVQSPCSLGWGSCGVSKRVTGGVGPTQGRPVCGQDSPQTLTPGNRALSPTAHLRPTACTLLKMNETAHILQFCECV